MNGYQLTFYTEQNRRHGHQTVWEWLLHEAQQLGVRGATVIDCAQGTGHAGAHHAPHLLRLADQPMQIILAVSPDECERLLELVKTANVSVFYTRTPAEFGVLGDDGKSGAPRHFWIFGRRAHQPADT